MLSIAWLLTAITPIQALANTSNKGLLDIALEYRDRHKSKNSVKVLATNSACRVLLPSLTGDYWGECKENVANGIGLAIGTATYEGEFKNGFPHGKGYIVYANGDVYEGEFAKGVKSGYGRYSWIAEGPMRGATYEGYFENDLKNGKGTLLPISGDRYDGMWQNERRLGNTMMEQQAKSQNQAISEVFTKNQVVCRIRNLPYETAATKGIITEVSPGLLTIKLKGARYEARETEIMENWLYWRPCTDI